MLQQLFSGQNAKQILDFDIKEFFTKLGLEAHLSMTRRNGLHGMVQRIHAVAKEALSRTQSRTGVTSNILNLTMTDYRPPSSFKSLNVLASNDPVEAMKKSWASQPAIPSWQKCPMSTAGKRALGDAQKTRHRRAGGERPSNGF